MSAALDPRPLVLHVVHRFAVGGLENGVVNLINHMPPQAYRHAVMALTEVGDFKHRVRVDGVPFISLNKGGGHALKVYPKVWRALRDLRPAVVHTRNIGPMEVQLVAALARCPVRIHGEHGRELDDLRGDNRRLQNLRRLYAPFVHRFVALSRDLNTYLVDKVGIAARRVDQIYNGVDAQRFRPWAGNGATPEGWRLDTQTPWVVGTVGRMQAVKNHSLLARAFARALTLRPELKAHWRLVMVGDGPQRAEVQSILSQAGLDGLAWLAGERGDVPEIMQRMHCFVLPSLAEGISNTILEAMACGLPVVATDVGGNAELVQAASTGLLVGSDDAEAMAKSLLQIYDAPDRGAAMGARGRREVEDRFSLPAMVGAYQALYDRELARAGQPTRKR